MAAFPLGHGGHIDDQAQPAPYNTGEWEAHPQVKKSRGPGAGRPPKRKRSERHCPTDAADFMVKNLSQNVLCEDYVSLLESGLPRWARDGLWPELAPSCPSPSSSSSPTVAIVSTSSSTLSPYSKLERAYRAVCQLDMRMSDDVMRNRIALVQMHLEYTLTNEERRRRDSISGHHRQRTPPHQEEHRHRRSTTASTVGRGDASHVIDRILENTHGVEWTTLDPRRQAELRAKFHDRKRYGKRWAQLADALGAGILLVCATKLANAV